MLLAGSRGDEHWRCQEKPVRWEWFFIIKTVGPPTYNIDVFDEKIDLQEEEETFPWMEIVRAIESIKIAFQYLRPPSVGGRSVTRKKSPKVYKSCPLFH